MQIKRIVTAATLLVALGGGCSGGGANSGDPAMGFIGVEETAEGTQVEKLDVNGDARPDVWRHYRVEKAEEEGAKPTRMMYRKDIDLTFDGRVDIRVHFDAQGTVTKEEFDLDFDGRVDMFAEYREGVLYRQAMDEGFDGSVDIWRYFEDGRIVRKERDADHDGSIDVWEYYEEGKLIRIGRDIDRDGKPELFDEAR